MEKFNRIRFCLFLASVVLLSSCKSDVVNSYAVYFNGIPFKMQAFEAPVFPKYTVSLLHVGGVGDGVTMNTTAFEKAFEALEKKGGGTLIVPAGVWFTGPIVLRSNVNLHLEKGALILFNPDFDLYPLVNTIFEGLNTKRCQSPISGVGLENVAITGEGSINGSGEAWRFLKRAKVTDAHWKQVVRSGGVVSNNIWFPTQKSLDGFNISDMNVPRKHLSPTEWLAIKDFLRPVMLSLTSCKNVLLQGVLFENSPSWNIHPLMCENVIIDGVFVRNPAYAQNGDGLDIESSKNVLVVNSMFDVGDDAICIKSGKDEDGRKRGMPTENVVVDNCKVFKGHGGFVVGSEMSGGARNMLVRNCQFLGTDVGLRFKSTRGRGGLVENVYIHDIYMFDISTDSFLFDLYYSGKSASESLEGGDTNETAPAIPPVTDETPEFRNIFVKNIVSRNARRAMYFNGLPEMNISNIHVEDSHFSSLLGAELIESDGIVMKGVTIHPATGPAIILNRVKNFKLTDLSYPENMEHPVKVSFDSKNIQLPDYLRK